MIDKDVKPVNIISCLAEDNGYFLKGRTGGGLESTSAIHANQNEIGFRKFGAQKWL